MQNLETDDKVQRISENREFPMVTLILPILMNLKDLFSVSWQFSIDD